MDQQHPTLFTRIQTAKHLNVSPRTVDNLRERKSIDYIKIGASVRFPLEGIEKFLKSKTVIASDSMRVEEA